MRAIESSVDFDRIEPSGISTQVVFAGREISLAIGTQGPSGAADPRFHIGLHCQIRASSARAMKKPAAEETAVTTVPQLMSSKANGTLQPFSVARLLKS